MPEKDSYSIEVREATRGGDDYTENSADFDTPEEVQDFIDNDMHEDEHIHSVLFYPAGTNSNPRDVTRRFKRKRK